VEKIEGRGLKIGWRPASTVILVRERGGELQVYLLKRSAESAFFPENYVFPGGAVDREDRVDDLWEDRVDMAPQEIMERLGNGLALEDILAYAITAIRETFEEAGAMLCRLSGARSRDRMESLCNRRLSQGLKRGWFWETVAGEGWILGFSLLARWSHWLTPELMRKHFDTRFFVAGMPEDQRCSPDTRETIDGMWIGPRKALQLNLEGKIALSPPTIVTLHELIEYEGLQRLNKELETRSWGAPRFPRLVPLPKGALILQPWDPERHQEDIQIDAGTLEGKVLPVGEPFSRLWLRDGIWRPVGL